MNPSGIEDSAFFALVWWVLAAAIVVAALLVVQLTDLMKAALALIVSFLGIAGIFVMLNAEFLAVVQLLIYAGAIPILIIFAILTLRDVHRGNPFNRLRVPALFLSALILAVLVFVLTDAQSAGDWMLLRDAPLSPAMQDQVSGVLSDPTPALAGLLLRDFALPLEAAAVLLLTALLGAMALVRDR